MPRRDGVTASLFPRQQRPFSTPISSAWRHELQLDSTGQFLQVPLNGPGGEFFLSNLTLSNIERVEVVRGPQSALFGSDAIGDVVLSGFQYR